MHQLIVWPLSKIAIGISLRDHWTRRIGYRDQPPAPAELDRRQRGQHRRYDDDRE